MFPYNTWRLPLQLLGFSPPLPLHLNRLQDTQLFATFASTFLWHQCWAQSEMWSYSLIRSDWTCTPIITPFHSCYLYAGCITFLGWTLPSSSSSQWSLPELSAGSWASNWQCGAEMVNNNRRKTAEVRRPASTAATAAIASIYSFYNCYEHQSETIFYCSAPALTFLLFSYIAWSLCWNTTTFNFCAFACAAVQLHSVQVFYSINWLHSFLSCCDNL